MKAFDIAIQNIGSQKKLAEILRVSIGAVNHVSRGRMKVPASWCPIIERETKRAVLCEELRPDIQWGILRGQGWDGKQ